MNKRKHFNLITELLKYGSLTTKDFESLINKNISIFYGEYFLAFVKYYFIEDCHFNRDTVKILYERYPLVEKFVNGFLLKLI